MNNICVLIDFTSVGEVAVEHAAVIAKKTFASVLLVHVALEEDRPKEKEIIERISTYGHSLEIEGIPHKSKIDYGEFFETIPGFIERLKADLVVVGTHGIRGIVQNLYASNILRLVNSMPVLTLVVQGHSEAPLVSYDHLLTPLIDEIHSIDNAKSLVKFSNISDSHISFINYIYKDDDDGLSTGHIQNIKNQFLELKKEISYDYEESSIYMTDYSKSIMKYASRNEVQLIVWLQPKSDEFKTFNEDDKENLILNRHGIPILYCP